MTTKEQQTTIQKNDDGTYPAYAWPGGYPLLYTTADGSLLCPACANSDGQEDDPDDPQWHIVAQDVIWEGPPTYCDHCSAEIESAYGDPDAE